MEAPRWRPLGPAVTAEAPQEFVRWLDPRNQDLTSWREMAPTVRKSLRYVKSKPQGALAVNRPGLKLTWGEMRRTLERLDALLPRLDAEPGLFLANFTWKAVPNGIDYSGYYEPYVRASRTAKPGYPQAIYKLPPDLAAVKRRNRGRYYDRRTIEEKQVLAGKGLELAWAADPVDVFFLEIQGSGRLIFDDGTQAFVNYAGQNGHKYKSSGRIMREKGLLKEGHIFEQREWFKNNPQRVNEILHENPSYVFFRFGNRGPTGAMGQVVDDWLSLATDRKYIPLGAVVAYGVNAPDPDFGIKAFSQPVTAQARGAIEAQAESLRSRQADVILLGCTELPLALEGKDFQGTPLVDPTRVLARCLVEAFAPHVACPDIR